MVMLGYLCASYQDQNVDPGVIDHSPSCKAALQIYLDALDHSKDEHKCHYNLENSDPQAKRYGRFGEEGRPPDQGTRTGVTCGSQVGNNPEGDD